MAATFARLGTDLRLLHDLLHQNSRNAGSDLSTITLPDRQSEIPLVDLETLSTQDNLEQALLLRFLTPMGELSVLGRFGRITTLRVVVCNRLMRLGMQGIFL